MHCFYLCFMDKKTEMLHSLLVSGTLRTPGLGVMRTGKWGELGSPAPSFILVEPGEPTSAVSPSAPYSDKGGLSPKAYTLTRKYWKMSLAVAYASTRLCPWFSGPCVLRAELFQDTWSR